MQTKQDVVDAELTAEKIDEIKQTLSIPKVKTSSFLKKGYLTSRSKVFRGDEFHKDSKENTKFIIANKIDEVTIKQIGSIDVLDEFVSFGPKWCFRQGLIKGGWRRGFTKSPKPLKRNKDKNIKGKFRKV